jgi:iron complex outermembrane receptor protein
MANNHNTWKRQLPVAMLSSVFSVATANVLAQNTVKQNVPTKLDEDQVQDVVVTAQRVTSLVSKTPVAITALTGEQLQNAGIDNPASLGARIPNVQIDGAASGMRITIRGVSNADTTAKGDPSAAFMLDGVYIARPQNQNVSFFDLDRVEVLRGPQGTLYGRNTTAGVINVISNTPGKVFEGAASAELGNYNSRQLNAMINVPVNDALAIRAAMTSNKHDSYLINGQGTGYSLGMDRDDSAARLSAKLAMGDAATLLLRYDYSRVNDNTDSIVPVSNFYSFDASGSPIWNDASTTSHLTNRFVPFNAPLQKGFSNVTVSGTGLEFVWNLGSVSLSYLASHRTFDQDQHVNFYYQVAPTLAIGVRQMFSGQYWQDSHEMRVATNGNGPLKAQAGVYYFKEDSNTHSTFLDLQILGLPPYYVFPMGPSISSNKAIFGQATYSLAENFRATAGVRFSDDEKSRIGSTNFQQTADFNPATDLRLLNAASIKTNKTTWRLGSEFDLSPDAMLFATVSTGFKAGGFNDGCEAGSNFMGIACPAQAAVPASALYYQPETLTSYEGGVRTKFWNNQASLNANIFYYDYNNLQLSGVVVINGAPRFTTTNAAVAKVKGLEVEGQLIVTAADRVNYSLALLDAKYDTYLPDGKTSWTGKKLDRSPSSVVTLGYEHTFHFDSARLKAGVFSRASSAYKISVPSQLLQYSVPARTQTDFSLSYRPNGASWSVQALVKNLENKVVPIVIDSVGQMFQSEPRTFGVKFDCRF